MTQALTVLIVLSALALMGSMAILVALLIMKAINSFMKKDTIRLKKPIVISAIVAPCSLFVIIVSMIVGQSADPTAWCAHEYTVLEQQDANCANSGYIKKLCSLCNNEITETIEPYHIWIEDSVIEATCLHPKQLINKCSMCGTTEMIENGSTIPHSFGHWIVSIEPTTEKEGQQTRKCSFCDYSENTSILKKSPIAFINQTYEIDYVGGVQWTFEIKNNSKKEIKYVTLEWSCCDSVGEPIYDDITGKNIVGYKFPGPWKSGETRRYQTDNTSKFYNHAYAQSKLVTIKVEYMDGEIVDINSKEYTDIFKTTSLNIPTLPYTIATDTNQPYFRIIDIEYEFVDINSSFVSGDGKKITNDFTYNFTCVYEGQEDRLQCKIGWKLMDSNGSIVYSDDDVSTIINSESKKFRFSGQCVDVIDPGETYTLEVYYID